MNGRVKTEESALEDHIAKMGAANCVAVIDFGTRGLRLIVGPRAIPAEIYEDTFKMLGRRPNIGLDVVNRKLSPKTRSLAYATSLIASWRKLLNKAGVKDKDISLISTAWFRWLDNREQISQLVTRRTGLTIEYIEQTREAELALLSLPLLVERWRGKRATPKIEDRDTVVLVDQGGGSLQVSWMRWGDRNKSELRVETCPFSALGTVARRRDFFRTGANDREYPDPLQNQSTIRLQVKRTREKAQDILKNELTLPTAKRCAPGRMHIFAVGSAITELAPDGVYKRHNYVVSADKIEHRLGEQLHNLNADGEQVRSIWRGMRLPEADQTDATKPWFNRRNRLDDILTALFGLPVYQEVLKQTNVSELTVSGYGLSYGYYFNKYAAKKQKIEGAAPDDKGPYLFVSYCHEDRQEVEAELDQLRGLRARHWYDREMRGGEITKTVADKIAYSRGLIVFLTENAMKSRWVKDEVMLAKKRERPIIPIVLGRPTISNEWDLLLINKDIIHQAELGPDRYIEKLRKALPAKCLRATAVG